jgi:predicted acylesterase/phospholipase RssA
MAERPLVKALVLQGGGALGAYELGVARALYQERRYAPDLIAGVSIGAITAVLLARPKGGDPLQALEDFWDRVTVTAPWLPAVARPYASMWGNPGFFMPKLDVWDVAAWTSIYSTEPLRRTLAELVDEHALADRTAMPRLLMTATDVAAGKITPFWSGDGDLTLDHVLASGSLPPGFPATEADVKIGDKVFRKSYWDGGVFDNTPLGEVIGRMKPVEDGAVEREIIVVNLFPNSGALPRNLAEVNQRMLSVTFSNKTESDLKLLARFNAVSALMREIRNDDACKRLRAHPAYRALDRNYIVVPRIVPITRSGELEGAPWTDFSPEGIEKLAAAGEQAAHDALKKADERAKDLTRAQFVAALDGAE